MNLAGNQAKNLFRSIRIGSPPSIVGIWAAATVVDQIRQRRRPAKQLLLRRKLKPGQSYVIRVPGEGEGSLKEQVPAGTVVAEVADAEESIGTELLSAAAGLVGAAAESGAKPAAAEATPKVSRRKLRRQARLATLHEADLDREALSRRRRRKRRYCRRCP